MSNIEMIDNAIQCMLEANDEIISLRKDNKWLQEALEERTKELYKAKQTIQTLRKGVK